MATREVEAKLILSAVDRTGRAFTTLEGRLSSVNKQAAAYNKQGRSNVKTAIAVGRAAALASTAVAAVGAASYRKFAGDERTLTRIGITAEATREEMSKVREDLFSIAKDNGLQFEDAILGLDALTASGRTLKEAMSLLPSVAATAQASGSEITSIATSSDALFTSLNIKAEDMQGAFDILVAGGKAGKFELKDMAQFLPSIAPMFKALGYEGEEGLRKLIVALQVVRTQTGTSGEAATAFGDVLTKMESQTTTNNFKRFGVDLRKELSAARKNGDDILQTFMKLSQEAVGGDLSKLPQLFTDKQMLAGMRALMTSPDAIRDIGAALKDVDGSTMKDLGRVLEDNQAQIDRMSNSWDRFVSSVGAGIAPAVGSGLDAVTNHIDRGGAISKGMEKDGLGFWARLSQHGALPQDHPTMIEWAKKGGFKFDTFEGGSRETGSIGIPSPSSIGGNNTVGSGAIPVPTSRGRYNAKKDKTLFADRPVFRPGREDLNNAKRIQRTLLDEDIAFAQTNGNEDFLAPLMSDAERRTQGSMTGAPKTINVSADTTQAETEIQATQDNAEKPVIMEVDADTSKAEAKIRKLKALADSVNSSINGVGSGRNLGRSMPGAGL